MTKHNKNPWGGIAGLIKLGVSVRDTLNIGVYTWSETKQRKQEEKKPADEMTKNKRGNHILLAGQRCAFSFRPAIVFKVH